MHEENVDADQEPIVDASQEPSLGWKLVGRFSAHLIPLFLEMFEVVCSGELLQTRRTHGPSFGRRRRLRFGSEVHARGGGEW